MTLTEFGKMKRLFGIENPTEFAWATTYLLRDWRIDVIKFDALMHERHGKFEEKGMSTYEIVEKEYGTEALSWLKRSI